MNHSTRFGTCTCAWVTRSKRSQSDPFSKYSKTMEGPANPLSEF